MPSNGRWRPPWSGCRSPSSVWTAPQARCEGLWPGAGETAPTTRCRCSTWCCRADLSWHGSSPPTGTGRAWIPGRRGLLDRAEPVAGRQLAGELQAARRQVVLVAAEPVRSGEYPTSEVAAPGGKGGLGQRDDRHPLVRAETLGGGDQPVQASGGSLQVGHQPHGDLSLVAETVPLQLGRQRPQQPLDQVVVLDADTGERGGLPLVEKAVVLPHAQLAQVGEVHHHPDPRRLPRQPRVGGERPAEEAGELPVAVADLAERLDPGGEQPPAT